MISTYHEYYHCHLAMIALLLSCFVFSIHAHQSQSFPGTGTNQEQAHVRGQQQPNPDGAHQHQHQPGFGGEQAKDEGHIKEHLDGKVDPTANMTPEQLQFHYFNMHDLNRDSTLDGNEILKAITHFQQEHASQNPSSSNVIQIPSEQELENMIDPILRTDDFNGDGRIDYSEFLRAQKQRDEQFRQQQPPPPRESNSASNKDL